MTGRSGEKVLADLLDSADAGAELVARGRAAFDQDRLLRLAGEAVIGRIGEAARKLLAELGEDLPQDIPWSDVLGARIVVDHAYHRVDYDVIWSTLERGTPLQAVSARLGHAYNSSTFITLDVYTGRNPELDRAAGELMDALLDGDLDRSGEAGPR